MRRRLSARQVSPQNPSPQLLGRKSTPLSLRQNLPLTATVPEHSCCPKTEHVAARSAWRIIR